jgi:hypothetical protein
MQILEAVSVAYEFGVEMIVCTSTRPHGQWRSKEGTVDIGTPLTGRA